MLSCPLHIMYTTTTTTITMACICLGLLIRQPCDHRTNYYSHQGVR